ncbi:hypothetical protein EJB05_25523 [Eragrostis curvula]|uniref:GDSL esterase/lipase n=1 Tax=Eragrostis curvula TaxID=38414 RepID=A0A5J9VFM7_9POAL|nr:hypothetical protein EJB05_25523 [Eragrostis curvula]
MRKQAVIAAALLAMAWPCSSTKMATVQRMASWLPDQQDDDPAMPGPPPSPPDEFDQPGSPLQESPLHQEYETAEPALPAPKPETSVPIPPHHQQSPPPPQMVPSSSPLAPPGAINNTATAWTTMLVFGDSTVDPGNNNWLQTAAKANFLPYGMSFYGGKPTGRFSNGRLITDIIAEKLGIGKGIPGFHDPKLKREQLMTSVSFASAGSGYDDTTARRSNVLSFSNQLEDLWHYKRNLKKLVRPRRAEQLVRKATFIISAGTTDLLFRYLPSSQSAEHTELKYENQLIARVANYTQACACQT